MGLPPPVWTRDQVAARILAGETLVIVDNQVVRVPQSWLTAHPGGVLAVLHFVGRDASDEVHAFHSVETLKRMQGYVIGRIQTDGDGWDPLLPPIMSGWVRKPGKDDKMEWYNEAKPLHPSKNFPSVSASEMLLVERDECSSHGPSLADLQHPETPLSIELQMQHSKAYTDLHQRVKDAGLYDTPYIKGYGPEFIRYTPLGTLSAILYMKGWLIPSAFFLGLMWQQLTFFVHDLGHLGVTHNWVVDRLIAIFFADFIGGLSVGWWVNHKLFYVVLGLARFNLYALSYGYLAKTAFEPKRAISGRWWWWTEIFCLGLYYCWYIAVLRGCGSWGNILTYLLVSRIAACPVHVQIVLSHFSRSTEDVGVTESFFARQLRTTVDVICSPRIEFIHGGLHLQVTHHLFPRLPRHNLRKASLIVKEYAKELGLEYAEFGFVEGNAHVRGVLKSVGDQLKIVGMVADANIQDAIKGS